MSSCPARGPATPLLLLSLLLGLAAGLLRPDPARAQSACTYDFTAVTNLIQTTVSQKPLEGASLLLVMDGQTLYEQVFGSYTLNTIVPIASATKWLSSLQLTGWDDFDAYWIPRGWAKEAPIKTQSRIDTPRPSSQIAPGPSQVAGVAWAPNRGISKVEVQLAEIAALGRFATTDAVSKLARAAEPDGRLFRKKNAAYRVAAVQALAEARTGAAMSALNALQNDRDKEVRDAAARGMSQTPRPADAAR